jgi:phage terminase large subunit-like protein
MLRDVSLRTFLSIGYQTLDIKQVNHSDMRVNLMNGAQVLFRSADEPDRLRGVNLSGAWLDEASYMKADVYNIVIASLREGGDQGWLTATFTPKGRQHWTYKLFGEGRPNTELFHSTTLANPFLHKGFADTIAAQYTSHLRLQELEGQFVDDVEGALWLREWIDAARVTQAPDLDRVVVAIDPAVTSSATSDETGICVAGVGIDGHYYILRGDGVRMTSHGWAKRAADYYDEYMADRIICEVNNGGDMVEDTIRAVRPTLPVSKVRASRGKTTRAEPIAALYEQGLVHHVGDLDGLESQLCSYVANSDRDQADDRMDALVWAMSELSQAPAVGISWIDLDDIGGDE